MDFSVVSDTAYLPELRKAWEMLTPHATVFESFVWHEAYLRYLLEFTPYIVVARVDGIIQGIAPLQRDGGRVLPVCHHKTDRVRVWLSFILDHVVLLRFLASQGVRSISCLNVYESELIQLRGSTDTQQRVTPCPVLDLSVGEVSLESRELRNHILRSRSHLARIGSIRHEVLPANDRELIGLLFQKNGTWWRAKGFPGLASTAAEQRFYLTVLPQLGDEGRAYLSLLYVAADLVSILLCFDHGNALAYYAGGHDPAYARWSPGTVHLHYLIGYARACGYRQLDFLRGGETYKYRFGATDGLPSMSAEVDVLC